MTTTANEMILESEAARLVGVSPRTLERFAEAGYLQVTTSDDGQKNYSRAAVIKLFGMTMPEIVETTPQAVEEPTVAEPTRVEAQTTPDKSAEELSEEKESDQTYLISSRLTKAQAHVIRLLEDETKELRNEVRWLKDRLEWFENKSERDQMLLLSETQTIHRLVTLQQGNKSFMQHLLEWLGVNPETDGRRPQRGMLAGSIVTKSAIPDSSESATASAPKVSNG